MPQTQEQRDAEDTLVARLAAAAKLPAGDPIPGPEGEEGVVFAGRDGITIVRGTAPAPEA